MDSELILATAQAIVDRPIRQNRTESVQLLSADTSEQIIQGHEPSKSADLLADAFGAQQVAHPSTRPDDAQLHAAARKLVMKPVQHARAGEIDMR
jgi:hypothetical protein